MKKMIHPGKLLRCSIPVLLTLLCAVCVLLFQLVAGTLHSVQTAERWRGENELRFAQIACFLPEDEKVDEQTIATFRRTVNQALIDASLAASETAGSANGVQSGVESAPQAQSLYADAYSGTGKIAVSNGKTTTNVKAIGVGGTFFLFHPLQLRSGSYISDTDLMQDRVVLDEELAWQLFGSSDVAGMSITISGEPYYVAGVVHRESDFASKAAYLDGAGLFMSFSALNKLTQSGISCYEIVLPDSISGYGLSIVEDNFPVGDGDVVEVSNRYSLANLWKIVRNFGTRSMRNNDVIYPYWENAARLTEDYLALLLVLAVLFGAFPVVALVVLGVRSVIRLWRWMKRNIPARLRAASEARREKNFARTGGK